MEREIWNVTTISDFGAKGTLLENLEGPIAVCIWKISIVVLLSLFVEFIFRDIRDFLTGDQKMGSDKETSGYHQIARHCHLVSLCL